MENNDIISVIVTVYNIREYIEKCIDSIKNQTYQHLEILVVDDGSNDGSGELCDNLATQDERIKVIHKPNGGLSDARNSALDVATGEYVAFVDGDDWIHPQMYELLLCAICSGDADISACNYTHNIQDFNRTYNAQNIEIEVLSGVDAFLNIEKTLQMAWNKLYRRKLFSKIRYPIGRLHEDEYVLLDILYNAKRVSIVDYRLYFYTVRDDSIMANMSIKRIDDIIEAFDRRISFAKATKNQALVALSVKQYCDSCLDIYYKIKDGTYSGIDSTVLKRLRENIICILKNNKDVSIGKRYKLFIVSDRLYAIWNGH